MFKNWKQICQIPDTRLMVALSLLDLTSVFGCKIAKQLPDYFTEERQAGPVPLSVLRKEAKKNGVLDGNPEGDKFLLTYGTIPQDWPHLWFGDEETIKKYSSFELIPPELAKAYEVGKVYKWKDKEIFLLEYSVVAGEEWCFVPAELVAVDL